jgi:hypothetical protein
MSRGQATCRKRSPTCDYQLKGVHFGAPAVSQGKDAMSSNEPGTSQGGRVVDACVILFPLLVAAVKLLPGAATVEVAELLGGAATAALAHALAALSLARAILGARRSALVGDWIVRHALGERVAERFRAAPAVADLIVSTRKERRSRNN